MRSKTGLSKMTIQNRRFFTTLPFFGLLGFSAVLLFQHEALSQNTEYYNLINIKNQMCLDVRENVDGGSVTVHDCYGEPGHYQTWQVSGNIRNTGGPIVNKLSGKCLDVAENRDGGRVVVQSCNNRSDSYQMWLLTVGGRLYNLKSRKALDVYENRSNGQVTVQGLDTRPNTFQTWHLELE